MKYEVILRLHEDDASGLWGLCNVNAVGKFNAFWGADGIFHDVFEHFVEDTHKYFRGNAAFTIWGEMCASGCGLAYRDIGIDNFKFRDSPIHRDFCADTRSILEEWLYSGDIEYPLEDYRIPRQASISSYNLNSWISEYYSWYDNKRESGKELIKQIKKSQITNAYLLGYRLADRIIKQDYDHSRKVLNEFLDFWNEFTKQDANYIYLMNEDKTDTHDYGIYGFRFIVSSLPKLSVKCTVLDDLRNEFPLTQLLNYAINSIYR